MKKKIFIILPYKESLIPKKSGAVSIYIKDSLKYSKYRNDIKVISSDDFNDSRIFRNKNYINEFCKKYKNINIPLIEIHNRPEYVNIIRKNFPYTKIILTYHNDPLKLRGSFRAEERKKLLETCEQIIFISKWINNRFFINLSPALTSKSQIIYHGVEKIKNISLKNKNKNILFVGKLNESKGYHIFVDAAKKFKKIDPSWNFISIGNEPRKKIFPDQNIVKEVGYIPNKQVLKYYEKSEIAIGNSKWDEPLGRIAIEASSRKCCPIISNVGGLIESKNISIVLKTNTSNQIIKILKNITANKPLLRKYQNKFYKNNNFEIKKISNLIDDIRNEILDLKKINFKNLKILHITNFNERFNGRLHYNTSKRLNNGFIRNGHNVLSVSDRDIIYYNKSISDFTGIKKFNEKVFETCLNFKPDLIVLGHADTLQRETILNIKKNINNVKICQWFLDPLITTGPDYKKNKNRIINLDNLLDASFLTTDPSALKFKIQNSYYMPNPSDNSFEFLNNSKKKQKKDLFFAMSHGVHRGVLKKGKFDEREIFLKNLEKKKKIDYDFFGYNKREPLWANDFIETIKNYDMGLNLSRGKPIKYYSSDRIVQIIGNGLLCFINSKTKMSELIPNNCVVYYEDINDLSKKIFFYKKNYKLMKKIADNGRKYYNSNFNSKIVSQFLIDKTFNLKNKYKYLWSKF